jgi:hypothetical protein
MSQKYMVIGAMGSRTKSGNAGEGQQQITQLRQTESSELLHDSQSCETEKYGGTVNEE